MSKAAVAWSPPEEDWPQYRELTGETWDKPSHLAAIAAYAQAHPELDITVHDMPVSQMRGMLRRAGLSNTSANRAAMCLRSARQEPANSGYILGLTLAAQQPHQQVGWAAVSVYPDITTGVVGREEN